MPSIRADIVNNVFISTAPRTTYIHALGDNVSYYESIVWEWDSTVNLLGNVVYMTEYSNNKKCAINGHKRLVNIFSYLYWRKRRVQL